MAATEMVTLRGGLTVSRDALQLGWDLECRGFTLSPDGVWLRVCPHERLTPEDVSAIRRHRDELLALVRYTPETVA